MNPSPRFGRWAAGVAVGAAVATAAVGADPDPARAQLEQRLKLAAQLMSDSATAQRIAASGNSRAQAHLDEGRVHQSLAAERLAGGDISGARQAVDEALKHIGLARRLVPDAAQKQAAARQRFGELDASLERLIGSWRERVGDRSANDSDMLSAVGLIGAARSSAQQGHFEEAVQKLSAAESHVLNGMNRTLLDRTLDYTARASTPAEEYRLELARLRSLAELVPLAVADLKPKPEARALIDRYVETSQGLQTQAQQLFDAGQLQDALGALRNALLYVQRALSSAGLVTPQPTGN